MKFILAIWLALSAVAAPPLFRAQNVAVDTAFSPADLPGLALWLDADDASTLTLSGSVVDEWRDKSGNGRNFTGSGSARPAVVSAAYNGRDAIQFDGVNDVLVRPGASYSGLCQNVPAVTVYMALRYTTAGAANQSALLIGGWGFTPRVGLRRTTSGRYEVISNRGSVNNVNRIALASLVSTTNWVVQTGYFDTANNDVRNYIDGTLDGTSTAGTAGNIEGAQANDQANIGNYPTVSWYAAMEVTEILVYHAAHDASTRTQVEAYLTR